MPRVKFDANITFGSMLVIITMITSLYTTWHALDKKLSSLEANLARTALVTDQNTSQITAIRERLIRVELLLKH